MNPIDRTIVSLLPPDKAAVFRAEAQRKAAREQVLIEEIHENCIEAMADVAQALKNPRISAMDLESAVKHLQGALTAARELDQ